MENLEYSYRQDWEQTRFISYAIAQTQSSKHLKPSDIISFGWDKQDKSDVMTKEDVERLTNKMNNIINNK